MSRDLVIGIDCSTTAAKAVVWDARGRSLAEGREPIPRTSPNPGWGEQDPADWWSATAKAIVAALRGADASRIAALCIVHQRESFACFDTAGEAIRPGILWLDTRATAEIRAHGSEAIHERTGKPPNTSVSWYKMLWLQAHEPDVIARTSHVADVHGYLVYRLTGRWQTSYGSVDPMGVLDMRSFALDAALLDQAGLQPGQLPELHPPGATLGGLRDDVAAALGLPAGLPVVAGLGDGQAAGLGAGVIAPGDAFLNIGTGMISGTCSTDYQWGREFRTMTGAVPGTYMPETFIGGGTYNVTWFADKFLDAPPRPFGLDLSPERLLETAAAGVPPGSDGMLALPYLSGALSPYWDSDARGVFLGFSERHGRAHMYRAMLEGMALEQRVATTAAEATLGTRIERFRIMGGGSRSALWCQIIADVLGRPVDVSRETETTCLGAGMLAAVGGGLHDTIEEAARAMSGIRQTYEPVEATRTIYDGCYEAYRQLYPRLRDVFAMPRGAKPDGAEP